MKEIRNLTRSDLKPSIYYLYSNVVFRRKEEQQVNLALFTYTQIQ